MLNKAWNKQLLCLISRWFVSAGSTSLILCFLKPWSNTALFPTQAWQSPSSPVAQRCRQTPGQHSLNGMRWSTCGCAGTIVLVTVKWWWCGVVCISYCSDTPSAFIFSTCLWKLSPPLIFQYGEIISPTFYINANAVFCPLFIILWSFVVAFVAWSKLMLMIRG